MAWKVRTTCAQCGRKLSASDRKLGTVCSSCVRSNAGRVWGKDEDDNYSEGE